MPTAVAAELKRAGGFWGALLTVLPALNDVAHLTRRSTSAGLSRADTGEALPESDGVHVYVAAKDGADSERFLRALHDRCWLAGFGWMMVSTSGALLERSIVDRMVGGPERLVFEGGPVLVPPLQQDKESRRPIAVDGAALDTVAVCPPLSIVERARLDELKARERARLAPEMAKARSGIRRGAGQEAGRAYRHDGESRPAGDHPTVRGRTAAGCRAAVRRPGAGRSHRRRRAGGPGALRGRDAGRPARGSGYGRCVAKIMRRADGTPWIHSFAHGRTIYALKYDAATVRKAMEKAAKEEVVATFALLAAGADIDAIELAELRQLAKKLSGVGLRVIDGALKAAQQKQAAQNAKAARARQRRAPAGPAATDKGTLKR